MSDGAFSTQPRAWTPLRDHHRCLSVQLQPQSAALERFRRTRYMKSSSELTDTHVVVSHNHSPIDRKVVIAAAATRFDDRCCALEQIYAGRIPSSYGGIFDMVANISFNMAEVTGDGENMVLDSRKPDSQDNARMAFHAGLRARYSEDTTIWLTGHSLRGAVVTILAMRLILKGYTNIHLVTHGAPHVGDARARMRFRQLLGLDHELQPNRYFRVVNSDLVASATYPCSSPDLVGAQRRSHWRQRVLIFLVPLLKWKKGFLEGSWRLMTEHGSSGLVHRLLVPHRLDVYHENLGRRLTNAPMDLAIALTVAGANASVRLLSSWCRSWARLRELI